MKKFRAVTILTVWFIPIVIMFIWRFSVQGAKSSWKIAGTLSDRFYTIEEKSNKTNK